MRVAGFVLCSLLLPGGAVAADWRVVEAGKDPRALEARLRLKVDNTRIALTRESDKVVLLEIAPTDVTAIWYDDYAVRNYGREWFDKMNDLCRDLCGGEDITMPLTLLAIGGVGYLAARPFEDRLHYANIQYRKGNSFEVITLRTNWLDHFWLMTDLSQSVGKRWLNIPLQRAKLFWSWTNRTQDFAPGSYAGKIPLNHQKYQVLLWEDGKGRGILMFFSAQDPGTPPLVAAEAVTVDKARESFAAYCRDADDVQHLLNVRVGDKHATLSAAERACAARQ
jgi:hypothetical protein